ncbi:MAG: formylglycine-generating enzyme family protein [Synechococcus sp.]
MAAASETLPENLSLYRYKRTNKAYTEDLGDGVQLTLMLIPSGEFMMGSPESEPESNDSERPQHRVTIRQFLMGRYPVTQAQWRVVAGYDRSDRDLKLDPSDFKGDNRPVENVSWDDAQEFCKRLSVKTGKDYCLPSEAQWEYACRAGTETPFHFGETITTDLANYHGSYSYGGGPTGEIRGKTSEVGIFPANDWGLNDMHGNVVEWCEDVWHDSYEGAPKDGSAWIKTNREKTSRLLRGGSWFNSPWYCRSASRSFYSRGLIDDFVGFRVCCVPPRILLSD